ncbi:MAG: hypothetical protein LUH22_18100 [Bacteroides sp.]|nr:hypothetical protein [Bacteroides sp.]
METKDFILTGLAIAGWAWGIIQFFVNRKMQKKDKLIDRKYNAYIGYMKKYEEIINNYRNSNISDLYGIPNDLLYRMISGNPDEIDAALLEFNQKLCNHVKSATEPVLIVKQELNTLRLICSSTLLYKIKELDSLIIEFNQESIRALEAIKTMNPNILSNMQNEFVQNNKWLSFERLNNEIIELMRKEIETD